jgi:hypothetical protein
VLGCAPGCCLWVWDVGACFDSFVRLWQLRLSRPAAETAEFFFLLVFSVTRCVPDRNTHAGCAPGKILWLWDLGACSDSFVWLWQLWSCRPVA